MIRYNKNITYRTTQIYKTQASMISPRVLHYQNLENYIQKHYSHLSSQDKQNLLKITTNIIPKLNIRRNQSRLSSTLQAILLFINTQSKYMSSDMKRLLASLIYKMETMYHDDPAKYVAYSKLLANWVRVNLGRSIKEQDLIPDNNWDDKYGCPRELVGLFIEISRFEERDATREVMRMILSILESYMVVTVPKMPNLNTITDPCTAADGDIESIDIPRCLEDLGVDYDEVRKKFNHNNTTPV
jgi:hypothetical protein